MSKIRDLYAIAEDIDDLVPEGATCLFIHIDEIVQRIIASLSDEVVHNYLYAYAEYDDDCDEQGRHALYFANYNELCNELAEDATMQYIEDSHLDVADATCNTIIASLGDVIARKYVNVECECVADAIDNSREDKWQREDYNVAAIINQD